MEKRKPTQTDLRNRTDDERRDKLGKAGEDIVSNYYSAKGKIVKRSINQYDGVKDLDIDNYKLEVKTMVPFISEDAFSFRNSQLNKCKNVDLVYFVSVPAYGKTHYSFGKVYRIRSEKMRYEFYWKSFYGRDGGKQVKMVKVPISQDGMQEVFTMTDEECAILQEYSTSNFNRYTDD